MSGPDSNSDIDPLTRLAIKYGTDKWGPHFYTPLYHQLLGHLRDRPVRLLEIGVGGSGLKTLGGASLAMWADYFPNGEITSLDIDAKQLKLCPRVKIYVGSQDDPMVLKKVCDERGPFDVILDDGSHVPKHVVTTFHILFPMLKDGGIYIIEDVQTTFWPNFGGSTMHGGETMRLTRTILECLHHAEIAVVDRTYLLPPFFRQIKALRAYHNIIVIDKGDNSEPSNFAYDMNNPHAIKAVKAIEQQMRNAPTAEGLANLSDVHLRGGNLLRAKAIADEAAARWPTNLAALTAAYTVATRQNDVAAQKKYLDRMIEIEPDNAAMRQARASLDPAGVRSS
jgi:hypothetical protein